MKELEQVQSATQPLLRSRILVTLGSLARRRHNFKAAESLYFQSIALSRKKATAPTPELASALSGLGALHLQAGRLEEAAQYLQHALTAFEGAFGPEHPVVIAPLVNVALIKRRCGDPEAAEPFARRAVELSERTLGPAHSLTAEALLEYSRILPQLHRKGDAKALEARARSILSNSMRSDPSALYTIDAGQLAAGGRR